MAVRAGLLAPLLPSWKWVEVHSDLSRTQCPGHHGLEQLLPPRASAPLFPSTQPLPSPGRWGVLLLALGTSSSFQSPRKAAQLPTVFQLLERGLCWEIYTVTRPTIPPSCLLKRDIQISVSSMLSLKISGDGPSLCSVDSASCHVMGHRHSVFGVYWNRSICVEKFTMKFKPRVMQWANSCPKFGSKN